MVNYPFFKLSSGKNSPQIAEDLASEIILLEDEKLAIEQNMLMEYSVGAGLHPMKLPVVKSLEIPKVNYPFSNNL